MNHAEIWFKTYHMGDNDVALLGTLEGLRLVEAWSGYDDLMVLKEDVNAKPSLIENFYHSRIAHHSNYRAVAGRNDNYARLNQPPAFDAFEEWDVYVLHIWDQRLFLNEFEKWLQMLIPAAANTGADDGTFDYYPDNWFVAAQIARAIKGGKQLYAHYRTELLSTTQYADEDLASYIEEY